MAHNEVVKGRASPIRRFLSIRVLLQAVTGVMTLALVAVLAVYALDALKSQERARRVPAIIDISNDLFVAVQNFRLERGNVYTSLATPGIVAPMTQSAIMAERQRSRSALDSALVQLRTLKVEGTGPAIADISEQRAAFEKLRLDVDAALLQSQEQRHLGLRAKWVEGYNGIADAIDRLSARMESELTQGDPFVANMVRIKQIAWTVREDTGRDRFRIGEAIANGKRLSPEEQLQFAVLVGRIEGAWRLIQDESGLATTPVELRNAVNAANRLYFTDLRLTRNAIIQDLAAGRAASVPPREWMTLATRARKASSWWEALH